MVRVTAPSRQALAWAVLLAGSIVGTVRPAVAQDRDPDPGPDRPRPVMPATPGDFLFGQPQREIGVRTGWTLARGSSDWYDFVRDQLTLGRRSFDAFTVGSDVGVWLSNRTAFVFGGEVTHRAAPSEYRRFVDNNRQPIEQSTRLTSLAVTGGVKYALGPRGRAIGQLAWIPRRTVPYVAAGGGVMVYWLRQAGDFVDFRDSGVFASQFSSRGWAPSAYVGGGTDVRLTRSMHLTTDVRYRMAAAPLSQTWEDFDPLDLSGLRVTVGTTWKWSNR